MRYCTATFDRFMIKLTRTHALVASRPGQDADGTVSQLVAMPYVRKQLDAIHGEALAKELREYGAWNDDELAIRADNEKRIVWLAAGDIWERTPGVPRR